MRACQPQVHGGSSDPSHKFAAMVICDELGDRGASPLSGPACPMYVNHLVLEVERWCDTGGRRAARAIV